MKIHIILFIATPFCLAGRLGVPLIIIDEQEITSSYSNIQTNPFAKMTSAYFGDIIQEAITKSDCVIIFVEDQLSTEDITSKDKLGNPFTYLHEGFLNGRVKYFPSVHLPMKTLHRFLPRNQFNVIYLNSLKKPKLISAMKYIYVVLEKGRNLTRVETLRQHDVKMSEFFDFVKQIKHGPIVGIYTGKMNPVKITFKKSLPARRFYDEIGDGTIIASQGALFKLAGVFSVSPTRRARFSHVPKVAAETSSVKQLTTTVTYNDFDLRFNFKFSKNGWQLESVGLLEGGEEVGRTIMHVGAPWNCSYVCADPLNLVNTRDGSSVTISKYQIQPMHRSSTRQGDEGDPAPTEAPEADATDAPKEFGATINCMPYFTAQILSGLLVVSVIGIFLAAGIIVMMDCKSNSRFDDPNGKEFMNKMDLMGH